MGQPIDLTGQKIGRLTVLSKTNKRNAGGSIIWLCKCDCGKLCERSSNSLRSKSATNHSCGCFNTENIKRHQYVNKKPFNKYDISGEIVRVYSDLNNEKYVLIDLKWLEYFKNYHIWYDSNRNAWTIFQNGKNKDIHQIIGGKGCDHIDRNRDNCLERNLRKSTHEQNCRNRGARSDSTTGFKGVRKVGKKFQGYVCYNGKEYKTSKYDNAESAARDRDKLAIKYHGSFAYLNFHDDAEGDIVNE